MRYDNPSNCKVIVFRTGGLLDQADGEGYAGALQDRRRCGGTAHPEHNHAIFGGCRSIVGTPKMPQRVGKII